jgi:hypothetical protein
MKKTKTGKKRTAKPKKNASRKVAPKAKLAAKKKVVAKSKAAPKRKARRAVETVQVGSQSVETVQLKPKSRAARAGAGGGDFGGVSIVETVDSESANELLEEGQAYEAGIVSGVEDADNSDEAEVVTHEVPQDDVPNEYNNKDRL